jgi:hypothetical protein
MVKNLFSQVVWWFCSPKYNQALLGKWLWLYATEREAL